jgi:hypothetical protein
MMSSWQEFKNAPVGHRFQKRYERRMHESKGKLDGGKIINMVVGLAIVALGIILIPAPGPGAMIVLFGAGLIGGEFLPVARFCDNSEVVLRHFIKRASETWKFSPLGAKVWMSLGALIVLVMVGLGALSLFSGGSSQN